MTAVWQRARSDEQKEHRRAALLHAAARMLEAKPIDEITLTAIARAANISKTSVYRYFESREELYLHLYEDAFGRWRRSVIQRLQRHTDSDDADAIAEILVSATIEHDTFGRLVAVLATVLERNVSTETVVEFKRRFLEGFGELLPVVAASLPSLSSADVRQLLRTFYLQVAGIWPSLHPAPAVVEALQRPELEAACVDVEASLRTLVVTTIAGLRAQSE